ncbi:MAG: hypothetical protein LWW95_10040 [Candidatus Desulfofervidus auxilii]|nr:hypothetical protein [Candidatus Desulfofervidus auxilii]
MEALRDLIIVTCDAAFKDNIKEEKLENPEKDNNWILEPFQIGEPPFYIEHVRRGIVHIANNPNALLVLSGGQIKQGKWSGAKTYLSIAKYYKFWIPDEFEIKRKLRTDVQNRTVTEDYARDSFENLLFSICRFQQVTGYYPYRIVVVSWTFKERRFDLHRAAIRFPFYRFCFDGFNVPIDLPSAWRREAKIIREFRTDQYGYDPNSAIGKRRKEKNPFEKEHPYKNCPGLEAFFKFIEDPRNKRKIFPAKLPWEG